MAEEVEYIVRQLVVEFLLVRDTGEEQAVVELES